LLKTALMSAALLAGATAAVAQNDLVPTLGHGAATAKVTRTVTITALGAYANQGEERLIDVRLDADSDGDGEKDQGLLRVTCNGGDILTGRFQSGENLAAAKIKPVKAKAASALADGSTFKGSWNLRDVQKASMTNAAVPLTLAPGGPDVCA